MLSACLVHTILLDAFSYPAPSQVSLFIPTNFSAHAYAPSITNHRLQNSEPCNQGFEEFLSLEPDSVFLYLNDVVQSNTYFVGGVFMHVCAYVSACMCVCVPGGQRLKLEVFLNHLRPYSFETEVIDLLLLK